MRYLLALQFVLYSFLAGAQEKEIRIVFTSDLHFGLKKAHFRNSKDSVSSEEVNKAMVEAIRSMGKIDYIIITGDITNREEKGIQSASASWDQFQKLYCSLHIPLLLVPGNHDISNAIGYYKPMVPAEDKAGLAGINSMMHRSAMDTLYQRYNELDFDYSKDIAGIHCMFITLWPDSANRIWMAKDFKNVSPNTPVIIFTHDPPEGDAKHFTNMAAKDLNSNDKFENLLPEVYNDHYEQNWDEFLKLHRNIKAYFHGHSNYQEFYTYTGVDSSFNLPCFRVDSPMKGKNSSKDESLLSFQLITINVSRKTVVVKECFWNRGNSVKFGEIKQLQF